MKPPTILNVDDSLDDALLLRRACQKVAVNFTLQIVHDGEKAIEYLKGQDAFADRSAHPFPSLLLLDLNMPRMSGFDVLQWLRTQSEFQKLPVAIFTSSQNELDIQRAYQLKADYYLTKPISYDSLLQIVRGIDEISVRLETLLPRMKDLPCFHPSLGGTG